MPTIQLVVYLFMYLLLYLKCTCTFMSNPYRPGPRTPCVRVLFEHRSFISATVTSSYGMNDNERRLLLSEIFFVVLKSLLFKQKQQQQKNVLKNYP